MNARKPYKAPEKHRNLHLGEQGQGVGKGGGRQGVCDVTAGERRGGWLVVSGEWRVQSWLHHSSCSVGMWRRCRERQGHTSSTVQGVRG